MNKLSPLKNLLNVSIISLFLLFFCSLKAQTPVYTRFIAQPDSFKARFDCNRNCDTVYYGYNYGFILKKISPRGDIITLDTLKPTLATQRFKLLDTMSVGNKFFFEWYDDSNGYFNLVVIDSTGQITLLPSGYLGPFFKRAFLINGFYYYQWLSNPSIYTDPLELITSEFNGTDWVVVTGLPDGTDIAVTITAPATYKKYTPSSFMVTAKNTGTTAAANIKLQLAPVANTVYGGTPTASAGDYKEFCPGNIQCRTWTIPNLNAGDSATLTVPVFVLDPNGANIIAKVNLISSTPTDGNPANDTASVTIVSSDGTTPPPAAKPDIAVSIASSTTTYKKYTFLNYTLTAKNAGSAEMRDIKIKFTPPNGTANPGDTKASAGIYNDYCAGGVHCQTWSIPVLGINQSATLVIPVFVLDPGAPITATATLTSSTPTDLNGTNDVGSVTTSQAVNFQTGDISQQLIAKSQKLIISPNPATDELNLEMQSTTAQSIQFLFYNMQGSNVKSEQRQTAIGTNQFSFDVSNLPSGLYYLQTAGEKINLPTVKLVKN